ncbi:glycoside hydrolase family 88 protein [Klebsiella variicola subsp. variicola]|nr:glycoside hydrolase family 88 protein [Klebsiella variicola subsp. variicola]
MIDTKGWAGWEWTHGVGLYGIYQYYQQTGRYRDALISSIAGLPTASPREQRPKTSILWPRF